MFKIDIQQERLLNVLSKLESTVGKDTDNMNLGCLSMVAYDTYTEFFTTNGKEASLLQVLTTQTNTTPETAPYVEFKRLKKIVSIIPKGTVITLEELQGNFLGILYGGKLQIKLAGNMNATMTVLPELLSTNGMNIVQEVSYSEIKAIFNKTSNIIKETTPGMLGNCTKVEFILDNGISYISSECMDTPTKRTYYDIKKANCTVNTNSSFLFETGNTTKALNLFGDYNTINICSNDNINVIEGVSLQNQGGDIIKAAYCACQIHGNYPKISPYYSDAYKPLEYLTFTKEYILGVISMVEAIVDNRAQLPNCIKIEAYGTSCDFSYKSAYGTFNDTQTLPVALNDKFNVNLKYNDLKELLKSIESDSAKFGIMQSSNGGTVMIVPYDAAGNIAETDKYTISSVTFKTTP